MLAVFSTRLVGAAPFGQHNHFQNRTKQEHTLNNIDIDIDESVIKALQTGNQATRGARMSPGAI